MSVLNPTQSQFRHDSVISYSSVTKFYYIYALVKTLALQTAAITEMTLMVTQGHEL